MEGGSTPYSSAMAPSGSYILIIMSQPVTEEHKKIILERLNKGLLSWDVPTTGCDLSGLESVCSSVSNKKLSDNDVLIQHSTESLGVEVLVNPTVSTLKQCIKNLFSTSTGHKHLIHAGYTFAGSGSWILQNGTFSFDEFLEIFQQADVQSQKRCNINVHCAEVGPWNSANFAKDIFSKVANIALNPEEKVESVPGSEHLINCLNKVLNSQALEDIMEASPLVGNIRFNRPTLYLFPAGQGDCALFGINGFNMLIDGGFNRKPCSWEFIRHLDRLDAVLVTRLCENNLCGMSTLMKRKALNNTYPQIGYVFCNIAEGKSPQIGVENGKTTDDLIVSVVNEGHNFVQTLNDLKLKPHQCWRDSSIEPFVLYHKVGHGTLEMHVLSPPRDSKEMKQFLTEWNAYKETFSCIKSGLKGKSMETNIPLSHATSICAVLVWRPADPKDTITRILFPGSAPQNRIFESLEKLKVLDILNQPVVTKASLSAVLITKPISSKVEKYVSKTIPNRKNAASPVPSVSSIASRNGDIGGIKKDMKKIVKDVKKDNKEVKDFKKEIKKEIKKDVAKESKRDFKSENNAKKESLVKKEVAKEVKKIVKKDNKELKSVTDKKPELKSTIKKETVTTTKTVSEVKKSAPTVKKTTTSVVKKEVGKSHTVAKAAEVRKSAPAKISELKTTKNLTNKKTIEAKTVPKTKPKSANTAPKAAPKTKPVAVPKPGTKVTKAVAASSIVAASVAVTAAAVELNEKKEEVPEDIEPEVVPEKVAEVGAEEIKDIDENEKPAEEINVSPLPPEALSPTPSESISLTPSDTLSSAPLETVSPTPPLANEPISTEEKEVNEIKDIEPDIPYETEKVEKEVEDEIKHEEHDDIQDEGVDIEAELKKHQAKDDVMSTSFIGEKDLVEEEVEDVVAKSQVPSFESTPFHAAEQEPEEKGATEEFEKELHEENEKHDMKAEEMSVDDRLAGLSMEGSFCANAEVLSSNDNEVRDIADEDNLIVSEENIPSKVYETDAMKSSIAYEDEICKEETFEKISAHEFQESPQTLESEIVNDDYNLGDNIQEPAESYPAENSENLHEMKYEAQELDEIKESVSEVHAAFSSSEMHEIKQQYSESYNVELTHEDQQNVLESKISGDLVSEDQEMYAENKDLHAAEDSHLNMLSQIQSMEGSFHQEAFGSYEQPSDIIQDAEMQETSVDEPEEIVRKESSVSITLNDEEPEDNYADHMRRKSGTESEDDVDIQKYMTKEPRSSLDQDKLCVQHDSESDDEDVVKSPTPHAVVDYEGHMDNIVSGVNQHDADEEYEVIEDEKELYPREKQDFDEKDHDSAEDQEDTDDGEMIRHPTPPSMKYSEEEMRDPIGQHFITTPGLKAQGSDITEQPLYEEAEDAASERSASPLVEQPVFGSTVEADYPELVTVSGGTTPSEPQSPKSNFDSKKFISDTNVMEALSEHDISESSTHSPLCKDEANTFDLLASDKNILAENLHNIQEQAQMIEVEEPNVYEIQKDAVDDHSGPSVDEPAVEDKLSVTQEDKLGVTQGKLQMSDEESCSHNGESEDDSDANADVQGEDKSDVHGDDKSDPHYDGDPHCDGKSDVLDDDQTDDKTDASSEYNADKPDDHDVTGNFHSDVTEDQEFKHGEESEVQYQIQSDFQEKYDGLEHAKSDMQDNRSDVYDDLDYKNDKYNIQNDSTSILADETSIIPQNNLLEDNVMSSHNASVTNDMPVFNNQELSDMYTKSESILESQNNTMLYDLDSNLQYNSFDSASAVNASKYPDISNQDHLHEENINIETAASKFEDNIVYDYNSEISDIPKSSAEFETGKPMADVDLYGSSDYMNEKIENVDVPPAAFASGFSGEISLGEDKLEKMSLDERASEYRDQVELHEDISPQHAENLSVIENKVLSEVTEARQYEVLSQYEENNLTSNECYSEGSLGQNILSDEAHHEAQIPLQETGVDDANFNLVSSEMKFSSSASTYESSIISTDHASGKTLSDVNYASEVTNSTHDIIEEKFGSDSYSENSNYLRETLQNYGETNTGNTYSDLSAQYIQGETQFSESQKIISSEVSSECQHSEDGVSVMRTNGFSSGTSQMNFDDVHKETVLSSESETTFGIINGKDGAINFSSSEYTEQNFSEIKSHSEVYPTSNTETVVQESSYEISNRFHSDSPEDNVMRTDSSPEVPYPTDVGQLPDFNSIPAEPHPDLFIQKEDFKNINFPSAVGVPISPNNHSHNANRQNPYGESSEDEDSSSLPGTVSPYAYTNKAYKREEEDIDGNRVYKEQTTEVIKQVEFDGNNPQTLNTHQVSSMMSYAQGYQEMQYPADANYDFRVEEWGKPMGLPTPPDTAPKSATKKTEKPGTSLGKNTVDANGKAYSPSVSSKMSSPLKKPKPKAAKESSTSPVYVDLAYVPHHGDPQYCDVEFFKKIRARYYVFSSINPSKEVLNALLEAKKSWNEDLDVTIIPTYETDTLGYWMAQNQDDLAEYSIEVAPSASRCTVNLQDHETSCAAYRLEF